MMSPADTVEPLTGLDDLLTEIAGSAIGCWVSQVVQSGGVLPPPLATTLLPTEPVASLSTMTVYMTSYAPGAVPAGSVNTKVGAAETSAM